MNNFYYYSNDQSSYLHATNPNDHWTISVSVTNPTLREPVNAYILLSRGGFK